MATIKNIIVSAKSRDDARVTAKKLNGKVIDNGKEATVRWGVKTDKELTLKHSSKNLFKGVQTIGKTNVFTKQGYKMHLALTDNLI
ncbi:hypothetical protein CPT_Michonne128 [Citrobacter phage Michonne]|uniref:Uncharacterized protein n=2 Tax=Mooglevirus mordin TaxID=1985305 RepID=A0A0K1LNG8_9CAUD|nr:hypothetical protein CPT_Michonne_gp102 [Citrobacter phage Michonne]YP_009177375.1 hypothetical protein CPT_Michonne_gp101 [Citrobacter phage Michonne]YP_009606547.1 hypothetical protein FDI02_gp017 [Citrobacter phage Mordin]AYR00867.1 hypothetical protein CPT_Maleficent_148 [Citrobacter phage Maleficent]AKU44076.1 hypothetical protein CPT_Michonne127 [Citrobacter phage Michonne]AKU44077.1 hypothetical protein CPT_Michonne128 [Citrobacter phage Michonne]ALA06939.1 hypothetical protein Mord